MSSVQCTEEGLGVLEEVPNELILEICEHFFSVPDGARLTFQPRGTPGTKSKILVVYSDGSSIEANCLRLVCKRLKKIADGLELKHQTLHFEENDKQSALCMLDDCMRGITPSQKRYIGKICIRTRPRSSSPYTSAHGWWFLRNCFPNSNYGQWTHLFENCAVRQELKVEVVCPFDMGTRNALPIDENFRTFLMVQDFLQFHAFISICRDPHVVGDGFQAHLEASMLHPGLWRNYFIRELKSGWQNLPDNMTFRLEATEADYERVENCLKAEPVVSDSVLTLTVTAEGEWDILQLIKKCVEDGF